MTNAITQNHIPVPEGLPKRTDTAIPTYGLFHHA